MFSKTNQGRQKLPKFKAFKAILSIALALAMVIASLPLGAISLKADETVIATGDCSAADSSVTWKITELETINETTYYKLTFSGNGEIKYYSGSSGDERPWTFYKIKEVVIEEGVTNIPYYAFWICYDLESIVLPESLQKIGHSAFSSTKISTIDIPANVSNINSQAFYGAGRLSAINVDSENKYYSSKNGVLFDKSGTDIKYCPETILSYEIPDGTKAISEYAFARSEGRTELIIPCSVMEINTNAFYCTISRLIYKGTKDQWDEVRKNRFNNTFYSKDFATGYSINVTGGTAAATAVPGSTVTVKAVDIDGKAFESWTSTESDVVFDDATAENTTFVMPDHEVNISGSHVDATTYTITVVDGTATKTKAVAGKTITVKANNPQTGKLFSTWTGTGVEFADAKAETTTFIMPANDVTITANYVNGYKVTVIDGNASSYFVAEGKTITISAKNIKGKLFSKWTSDEVSFTNANAASTTFTMPSKDVTVKANYVDNPTFWYCGAEGDGSNVTWSINAAGDTLTISGKGAMKNYGDSVGVNITRPWESLADDISSVVIADGITEIGYEAFRGLTMLSSITVPDSVTRIGEEAFYDCSSLTLVNWGSGIREIGDYAFTGCDIKSVLTIPDSVEKIGKEAFSYNKNLVSVNIGKNTNPMAWGNIFKKCDSLASVSVDSDNTAVSVTDGVLFSKDGTKIIWYPSHKTGTTYDIPESVTEIGDYAFWENILETIVIPGNVKKIGIEAFKFSDKCKSLTISQGVEEIGDGAFGLFGIGLTQDIVIPKSVKKIGSSAFGFNAYEGNIIICGENVEFKEGGFTHKGHFYGKIITPASNECDNLFGGTKKLDFKYKLICSAPVPDTDTFEYNGSEITFIEEGANCGYTLTGNKNTKVGNYTATATLNASRAVIEETNSGSVSYVWGDLSKPETWADAADTTDKTYEWSIKAPVVLSSIAVTTAPKTTYTEGESFDATGMVVTATYSDGTTGTVTGYTCTPLDKLATTDKAVTVSYTENGVTVTTTLDITVQAKSVGPVEYVTVQIIPGKNMADAHVGASGALVQKVALGTEIDVVGFQFNEDFDGYIPENYTVEQVNGITVKCVRGENGIGTIQISGTPTADVTIQLPDAGSKKADEEAKKNNTGSENSGTDSGNNSSDSGKGGTESDNNSSDSGNGGSESNNGSSGTGESGTSYGDSGYNGGGSGSNSSYNGGSSNYSGGSGTTSGGSGNTGSSNAGSGSASGSGNKNGNETNTSGSGATTNPDTKVKENSDGTKTETVVKTTDDGSTVKTQTTKDAEGKVLQTVTQKTETTTDGSTVTTKSTENNDGTYTTSTKTVNTDGSTVTKTESKDAEGTITSKEVTKTKDSTVTVEETKTEAGDTYTKETTKTAGSTIISENTETADGTVSTKVTTKTEGSTTVEEKISSADNSTIVRKSVTDKKGTSTVNETKTDNKGNVTTTEETVKKNGTGSSKSVTVDKDHNEISATSTETKKDKKGTLTVTSETVNKNAEGSEVKSVESSVKFFKSGEVKTETTEKSEDGSSVTTKNTINVDENGNLAVISEVTEIDAEGKETKSTTSVTVEVDESGKPVLSEIATDGKTAVIPDVVVSDGQIIPVTSIGDGAMKGNKKVTDVKLGKNITEIGAKAFYKDKKLKNIGLTGSIQTIEKKAFKGTAKDAVFTISATSKKEFKRVKKLVIKAGASKSATFVYEKESK